MPLIFPPIQGPTDDNTLANLLGTLPPANVVSGGGPLGAIAQAKAGSPFQAQQPVAVPSVLGTVGAPSRASLFSTGADNDEQAAKDKLAADTPKPYSYKDHGVLGNIGHVAGRIGNIIGDVLDPAATSLIPHSDLWNAKREAGDEAQVQQKTENAQAAGRELDSVNNEQANRDERTAAAAAKPGEDWSVVPGAQGPNGEPIEVEKGSGNMRIGTVHGGGVTKTPKPGEEPLGASAEQQNQIATLRYQVLHPGEPLPKAFQLTPQSTQKDAERIEKGLQGVEGAEATNEQRKQTAALRQQAAATAAQNRDQKGDTSTRKQVYTAYQPVMDSSERYNIMTQNAEDALKNHDQQAMLSLLANHLGMTMGLQKGARITKDTYQEAAKSQPWLQGLAAKFDKDGYLSGVTLSPGQIHQMVGLARDRYKEDVSKARNEANYLKPGRTDDGPDRTPSRSTMNYYLSQTNGDVNKAKQLAVEDGWSVK